MAIFNVNPDAEVSQFTPVKAGKYLLRIKGCTDEVGKDTGNEYFKWQLVFVDGPDRLSGIDGKPLKGVPSSIFYNTMKRADLQWKLRALVEAAIGRWEAFEPTDLYGKEIDCVVTEREYNGSITNDVSRVILPE